MYPQKGNTPYPASPRFQDVRSLKESARDMAKKHVDLQAVTL